MNLKNSTILITGGTSGIGLEFVKQLTEIGANIIITARSLGTLESTKQQFPKIHTFQCDISKPDNIVKLFNHVTSHHPSLNIILNNAGQMRQIDLLDTTMDLEDVNREIVVNLSGTIQLVHQFLPHLMRQKSSAIINVSSAIAFMAYSIAPIYSASKAGLHSYTKALRLQLLKTNVKVFEVMPPGVKTNLQNDWIVPPIETRMMNADKMVREAIKGLLEDKKEITPGLAGMIKTLSRIAPEYIEKKIGHKEFEKLINLKKK
jgi:uncharacterized oxidoreductase